MAFEKITDTSLVNKGVTGLPDVPGLTTAEMQAKFDELSRDVIIPKLNEIVDGLNGDEVGLSSQIENPETKEKDVIQNVVNAIYQVVKENSDKRHDHENKETLDKVTSELYESITELVSMFNGISAVDKTVTADDSKIPTSGAIVNYVTDLGAGDMQKAVYDKDNTGIVDDAKKLGGVAPEEYLQKSSLSETAVTFEEAETRSNISTGEKVSTVFGKIKKFFADLTAPAFAQMITSKDDLLATKVTGYVPDAKAVADTYTELNGKLQSETSYVPILSNYVYSSQTLALKIFGNAVQIKIPTLQNVVHGDNVICSVGAIPEKCRPSSDTSFTTIATNGGGNTRYICTIRPDGSIWIYNYGTYSGAENFSDTFVYLL